MAEKLDIKTHDNPVDQLTAMRKLYSFCKAPNGCRIPKTTVADVKELAGWWEAATSAAPLAWNSEPGRRT